MLFKKTEIEKDHFSKLSEIKRAKLAPPKKKRKTHTDTHTQLGG